MSNTDFGTGETPATVRVDQLEPGVKIDGFRFNSANTLIVQEVHGPAAGLVRVLALEQETGETLDRTLRTDRMITTWGRI